MLPPLSLNFGLEVKGQRSSLSTTIVCQRPAQELSIVRLCTYADPGVENLWLQQASRCSYGAVAFCLVHYIIPYIARCEATRWYFRTTPTASVK